VVERIDVLVLGVLAFAAALQGAAVPMRTLDKGFESQIEQALQTTVRTADEWSKLWARHAGQRPRPEVDFSREMVIAVFAGSRATAGFGIEIVSVQEESGGLVVRFREKRPRRGAVTAQVITSPFEIIAVPRSASVRFEQVDQ
jgi:hypothetical protein